MTLEPPACRLNARVIWSETAADQCAQTVRRRASVRVVPHAPGPVGSCDASFIARRIAESILEQMVKPYRSRPLVHGILTFQVHHHAGQRGGVNGKKKPGTVAPDLSVRSDPGHQETHTFSQRRMRFGIGIREVSKGLEN